MCIFNLLLGLILGCYFGNWLTKPAFRLFYGSPILAPSRCQACGIQLSLKECHPLSFITLKGRCPCKLIPLDIKYPIIEISMGLLGAYFFCTQPYFQAFIFSLYFGMLLAAIIVDLDYFILPDELTIGSLFLALIFCSLFPHYVGQTTILGGFLFSFYGMLMGTIVLMLVWVMGWLLFKKEAMGIGDVKLVASMGGLLGIKSILFILTAGVFTSLFTILFLSLYQKNKHGNRIPFGPYLAFGGLLWVLGGKQLIEPFYQQLSYIVHMFQN